MPHELQTRYQYITVICISLSALSIGNAIGWTSNLTYLLEDGELNEIDLTHAEIAWVGSLMPLGAMFMCCLVGWLADAVGRKPTVLLTVLLLVCGWLLIMCSDEITLLYIGRFFVGAAVGSICIMAPLYTSEIMHQSINVRTFYQLFIVIGILYSGICVYILPLLAFHVACLIIPIIFGMLFTYLPETQVYEIQQGCEEDAENTIKKVRGTKYDFNSEIRDILLEIQRKNEQGFFHAIKSKAAIKSILICFGLMFYQQFTGITAVTFYSQELFCSQSILEDSHSVIVLQVIQVGSTVLSIATIDRFRRKVLLIISATLVTISTGVTALFFTLKDRQVIDKQNIKSYCLMPILSLNVFIAAFSVGLGPIPWIIISEIVSPEITLKCRSALAIFHWLLTFCVSKFYFDIADSAGTDVVFYIFSGISATAILFIVFVLPETRGKAFEEIQMMLGGNGWNQNIY